MEFTIKSITCKGTTHDVNEDCHAVDEDYIIIADGMGGESSGDVASRLAVLTITSLLNAHLKDLSSENDIKELSLRAILKADAEIMEYERQHPDSLGMGTTVVLLIRRNNKGFVCWCGDSRCYLYNGRLQAVTKDHSYVQDLIDQSLLSEEESFSHPNNNLITKYVGGGEENCIPDFTSFDLKEGISIMLCSDGLSGYCKHADIEQEIASNQNEDLPNRLLKLAVKNGSEDDITIITMTPKKCNRHSIFSWFGRRK